MAVTYPINNTWLSAYQPILFGIDDPAYSYNWVVDSVVDFNGKAKFIKDGTNPYGTPPSKYIRIPSGLYQGVWPITSITDAGDIITEVPYAGNQAVIGSLMTNLKFKIYYGYPSQVNTIELAPVYKNDGTLIANLSSYLQSVFTITPPVEGVDESMFTWFTVQIIGADDFNAWAADNSQDPLDIINTSILFNEYAYGDYLWYVCNGVLPHSILNADYAGLGNVLSFKDPIVFSSGAIVSKIIGDKIYNIFM